MDGQNLKKDKSEDIFNQTELDDIFSSSASASDLDNPFDFGKSSELDHIFGFSPSSSPFDITTPSDLAFSDTFNASSEGKSDASSMVSNEGSSRDADIWT